MRSHICPPSATHSDSSWRDIIKTAAEGIAFRWNLIEGAVQNPTDRADCGRNFAALLFTEFGTNDNVKNIRKTWTS
jgi:hypothetical protein